MGYCLTRDHQMALGLFPLVQPLHPRTETDGKLRCFHIGPLEIRVAIVDVALTFPLAVTDFRAPHTTAVRGVVAHRREAANLARFQHDCLCQNRPDARDGLQLRLGRCGLQTRMHELFQGVDLLPQAVQNGQTAGDCQDLLGLGKQAREF